MIKKRMSKGNIKRNLVYLFYKKEISGIWIGIVLVLAILALIFSAYYIGTL